jgi:cyclic pyranopterin phosphate synthase
MTDLLAPALSETLPLVDPFGRVIRYLRVSVTDRCDFRCVYCMPERMAFLPKPLVLTIEELDRLSAAFIRLGTRRIRITGGEPLVRRDVMTLIRTLGSRIGAPAGARLDELTMTTNGSQLARFAVDLAAAGIRRINVSLDTLDAGRFTAITRGGKLQATLEGIEAANAAGIDIKINTVALRGLNEDELEPLVEWCGAQGHDLCFIETMPLGEVEEDRTDRYLPLSRVRERLASRFTLAPSAYRTGGPARYVDVLETGTRLGFITPMTHNFCESCNRVRLSCTGMLYLCLGQDDSADLRAVIRSGASEDALDDAIRAAIARKPKGHDFIIDRAAPKMTRHMSATGG